LYDPSADAVHVLNRTALAIWDLCDGKHTFEEIESAIRNSFSVGEGADVGEHIHGVLDRFRREGLIDAPASEG
jgi:hypothetical protein